jgi:hypothetical protein
MNHIFLFLGFALPIACGYLAVSMCLPKNKSLNLLKISLAPGIGLGISSVLFFILKVSDFSNHAILIFDICFFLAIVSVLAFFPQKATNPVWEADTTNVTKPMKFVFWVLLITSASYFVLNSINNPHGAWDAWAHWNVKAKFLTANGQIWKALLSLNDTESLFRRLDYPLGLSCMVSRLWIYSKNTTVLAPIIVAFLFTYSVVGVLFATLKLLKGKYWAYIGTSILLAMMFFTTHGSSQYADIVIAFCLLASVSLVSIADRLKPKNMKISIIIATLLGLAIWTKNEGRVVFIAFCVSYVFVAYFLKKIYLKIDFTDSALAIIPFFAVFFIFKRISHFSEYEIGLSQAYGLLNLSRWMELLKEVFFRIFKFNDGLLVVFFAFVGFGSKRIDDKLKGIFYFCGITLILMICGYLVAYIVAPYPILFNINNSFPRLVFQILPTMIFTLMLVVKPIELPTKK